MPPIRKTTREHAPKRVFLNRANVLHGFHFLGLHQDDQIRREQLHDQLYANGF